MSRTRAIHDGLSSFASASEAADTQPGISGKLASGGGSIGGRRSTGAARSGPAEAATATTRNCSSVLVSGPRFGWVCAGAPPMALRSGACAK